MWDVLIDHFRRFPAQERVVRLMIQHGLSIPKTDGPPKVCAGQIELADVAVARAAGVDRRIVRSAVETIAAHPRLSTVFAKMRPAMDLRDVAPDLGCGVVEIIPDNAEASGILAGVSRVIAEGGLAVRQAIGEDPGFQDDAKLFVITETPVPSSLIPALQQVQGIRGVAVF